MKRWTVSPYWWRLAGYPRSNLCVRCRDTGVIREADPTSLDSCHGHLAEDRMNDLIKRSGAWWA